MARVRAPSRELQATSVSGLLQPSDSPHSADAIAAGFVLLVGDAPLLLRALQRILQLDGHRVALAVTGSEFEEGLADVDLGVVLIDLAMRHVSGLDVLNRVKAERPEAEVVVMTGRVCVENAIRCLRRGAFDYVAKPFEDL